MNTYTASIFVELEIKVSGTLVPSDPPTHDPPYPGSPGGWDDITIEEISYPDGGSYLIAPPWRNDLLARQALRAAALDAFLAKLETDFADEITEALTAEVPEGPDPDDARDRQIYARLMGDD